QAEDGIRDKLVTGVQTCALPIYEGDAAYQGMEIQILDNDAPRYRGKLHPAQYHGSLYDVIPAKTGFLKPTGEWNEEEITANGRQIGRASCRERVQTSVEARRGKK